MREWWKDTFNDQFKRLSVTKQDDSEQRQGFAQTLSTASENRFMLSPKAQSPADASSRNETDLDEPEQSTEDRFDSLEVTVTHTSRSHTNDALPTVVFQEVSSLLEVPGRSSTPTKPRSSVQSSDGSPPPRDPTQEEQVAYKALQRLFSRASHLIRESSDLDGIIFIDASLQDIGVEEKRQKSLNTPANTPRFGGLPESSTALSMGRRQDLPINTVSTDISLYIRQGFKGRDAPNESKTSYCQLLGYSLNSDSKRHGDAAPSDQHLDVPQPTLRSLLRKYPNGNIFLFSSDGTLLDDKAMNFINHGAPADRSRSPSKHKSKFEKDKDQLRAYQLLDICPGARGIIFFPLWDPQRDQVSILYLIESFAMSHYLTFGWNSTC